jgi:hypothetical protein
MLQVTVSAYADPSLLKGAKTNLDQGLAGPPKKMTGIGEAAYGAKGALAVDIHFAVAKYIVLVVLTDVAAQPKSPSVLVPVAKDVAAKLAR